MSLMNKTFICAPYRSNKSNNVNELRYAIFSAKKGKVESYQLPPCHDTLSKHIARANYKAFIWRRCLEQAPFIPSPENRGWIVYDGAFCIDWMDRRPAPDAVLEMMSCSCKRKCSNDCPYRINGLLCTDMRSLRDCDNFGNGISDLTYDTDDEDMNSDHDEIDDE